MPIQLGVGEYDPLIVLAVIAMLLANILFLFRIVPWSKPGSWRLIFVLAAVASVLFIASEAVVLGDTGLEALDSVHQVPLFGALLATFAGSFLVYADAYRSSERTRVLSLTDALTGLPNRRAFEERIKIAYEHREEFTLLYVDLDGFKQVNDRLGHESGDQVLQQVAGLLRQCVRQMDVAVRMGGDEFCLFLAGADPDVTRRIAERVLAGMRTLPFPGGATVGASFGIATQADGKDARAVLAAADAAMYRAKRAGGDRIALAFPLEPAGLPTA